MAEKLYLEELLSSYVVEEDDHYDEEEYDYEDEERRVENNIFIAKFAKKYI